MVPGFVVSSADGPLLHLMFLICSCFDLSWPLMTSEDAQTLHALQTSCEKPTAG